MSDTATKKRVTPEDIVQIEKAAEELREAGIDDLADRFEHVAERAREGLDGE